MMRRRLLVMLLAFVGSACTAKESDFFAPEPIDPTLLTDLDAPVFAAVKPVSSATVLNSNVLSFTLTDVTGPSGAVPSGLDEASVTATVASGPLTLLNATPSNYTGSFASLNDGAVSLTLSAKDKAGNTRTSTLNFTLDRTAPLIGFLGASSRKQDLPADSVLVLSAGTIADASFAVSAADNHATGSRRHLRKCR